MMQVYYTERIEDNCHQFEFVPQLRGVVAVDRIELQDHRLGGDAVMEYAAREAAEKFWQTLQELAQNERENVQFIKVDNLNLKTLNEAKELNHLRILYQNHFKRQRRKSRKKRSRR